MKAKYLPYYFILKKLVFAIYIILALSSLPVRAQIKYVLSDERRESGMGIERVAMLFTATYESKVAKNDKEIRWIQIDLGEKKKIDGIKLLPKISIPGSFVSSVGFPSRFKIEVSDDPQFKVSIMYQDQTRADFKDPYDEVCMFSGKEVNARYVRFTAVKLRQQRLALTKIMIMSDGMDIAEGCPASDSEPGNPGVTVLSRPQRPQGEGVVTDNPDNIIPFEKWNPVAYKAQAPIGGVELSDGLFKKTMENNIGYLMSSFTLDELVRNFMVKAGNPVKQLEERLNNFWMVDIPGSEAGRFLMGAGNTLRWIENAELRNRMNKIVDVIDECKEPEFANQEFVQYI